MANVDKKLKPHYDCTQMFPKSHIHKMLEYWLKVYITFLCIIAMFDEHGFKQTVGIPRGANCVPLLGDLFLYSYEADVIQVILDKNEKKLPGSFNLTFRYIDDVFSLYK